MQSPEIIHLITAAETLESEAKNLRAQAVAIKETHRQNRASILSQNQYVGLGKKLAKASGYNLGTVIAQADAFATQNAMLSDTAIYYAHREIEGRKKATKGARDREVLRRAHKGHTNAEIARALGISPRTISRVIAAAYRTGHVSGIHAKIRAARNQDVV